MPASNTSSSSSSTIWPASRLSTIDNARAVGVSDAVVVVVVALLADFRVDVDFCLFEGVDADFELIVCLVWVLSLVRARNVNKIVGFFPNFFEV